MRSSTNDLFPQQLGILNGVKMIIFKIILQQDVEGEEQSVEVLKNHIFLSHCSFLGIMHLSTSQFAPPTS